MADPNIPNVVSDEASAVEKATPEAVLAKDTRPQMEDVLEAVAGAPRLAVYKEQYERWPAKDKAKISWQNVQERLLANNGHYLSLASAMNEGGILFGIDTESNPLIADGGLEPIMCGMDYFDTRDAVRFTRNDKGEKTPTGYEMFGYSASDISFLTGLDLKSPEIESFETFTRMPFVSDGGKEEVYSGSWLESGDCDESWDDPLPLARHADFNAHFIPYQKCQTEVSHDLPQRSGWGLGVRRLLRVKKAV